MDKIFLNEHPNELDKTIEMMGKSPYYRTVDSGLLKEILLKAWIYELGVDEYLIRETNKSDRMVYILINGEFNVYAGGKFILKIDQLGQTIGEMAVLSPNTPRSADVIAASKSKVVAFNSGFLEKNDPQTMMLSNSFLRMISNVLSEKLRITTDRAKLYENAVLENKEIDKYNKEITDISKDLKKELQQKLEQIKLFSQVVESNQDAIITSDEQGKLLTGNQSFLTLFGYSSKEIECLSLKQLFEELNITVGYEMPKEKGWKGQKEAYRKDKSSFPALITISPVQTNTESQKEKIVFATVVRDISLQKQYEQNILKANDELKQTYAELENTLKELERSNKVKDRFLSNISSQLKTPLDSLINYAELMKKNMHIGTAHKSKDGFLAQIMGEGKKLEKLVGNLITMAELTSELNLSLKVIKFESLMVELKKQLSPDIKALIINKDPELSVITADKDKLLNALVEIIEYAAHKNGFDTKINL
ncbi:PAS domain S-box protein, partial [bacterium]|nr:PAS domain S-box protein [bacterium]